MDVRESQKGIMDAWVKFIHLSNGFSCSWSRKGAELCLQGEKICLVSSQGECIWDESGKKNLISWLNKKGKFGTPDEVFEHGFSPSEKEFVDYLIDGFSTMREMKKKVSAEKILMLAPDASGWGVVKVEELDSMLKQGWIPFPGDAK